jgi:dihydrofolate reductase
MRKLIVEEWISLDGYVADRNGSLDFFVKHVLASYVHRQAFLQTVDTIVFGRKTYEQFAALWPDRPVEQNPLSAKINTDKKVVFSDSLNEAAWGRWEAAEIKNGDLTKQVHELKSMPGKDMVVWGSITLVQALMKGDLVDEYHLHICPVLTAGGRKLFSEDRLPSSLSLLNAEIYDSQIAHLHYQRIL